MFLLFRARGTSILLAPSSYLLSMFCVVCTGAFTPLPHPLSLSFSFLLIICALLPSVPPSGPFLIYAGPIEYTFLLSSKPYLFCSFAKLLI